MKLFSRIYFYGLMAMVFITCKEPPMVEPETPAYIGVWKIVEAPAGLNLSYMEFSENQFYHFSNTFWKDSIGFRTFYASFFDIKGGNISLQLDAKMDSMLTYQFAVTGNLLTLSSMGIPVIRAVRSSEKETENWMSIIDAEDNFFSAGNRRGMGHYEEGVLMCDYYGNNIEKFNVKSKAVVGNISLDGASSVDVTYDDSFLWVTDSSYSIRKYHADGGAPIEMISGEMGKLVSLVCEPQSPYIWCYGANGTLYSYQKHTGKITSTTYIGKGFTDIEWLNGKLYLTRKSSIYRVNPSPFTIEKSYHHNMQMDIFGISAYDNKFLLNLEIKLVQVSLN